MPLKYLGDPDPGIRIAFETAIRPIWSRSGGSEIAKLCQRRLSGTLFGMAADSFTP
jgi:hypothetical protein